MAAAKTGTSAMWAFLYRHFEAEEWTPFPSERPTIWRHANHLHKNMKDYTIFATERNPYTFAVSHYRFWKWPMKFDEFVSTKLRNQQSLLNQNRSYKPPKDCLRFKIDYFLKMENLSEEIYKLPFVKSSHQIDFVNKSGSLSRHKRGLPIISPEVFHEIYKHCEPDFTRYDKTPPKELRACSLPLK
jgi:hypothetical protein